MRPLSAMDVRSVDPEEVLVDSETLNAYDVSADIDEDFLKNMTDHGNKDKVQVSIRCVGLQLSEAVLILAQYTSI